MSESNHNTVNVEHGVPIKAWTKGVKFEEKAEAQLRNVAKLPFVYKWVAVMPDVHHGIGATVGSVLPTLGAIIPAAVGVDIGCGMIAVRTQYAAADLPTDRKPLREAIEADVTRGHTIERIAQLTEHAQSRGFDPARYAENWTLQLGTLGSGNHFIEVSLD